MDLSADLKSKYPWLPRHIPESQYRVVLMLAQGHSYSWIAKTLGISKRAVHNRVKRFAATNPEYYDNLRSILNCHHRFRQNFRRPVHFEETAYESYE